MNYLSNKDKKELSKKINLEISKKDEIKKNGEIYFFNNEKFLIGIKKDFLIPHLNSFDKKIFDENNFKKIFVDNGAVSFMVKGANLMKPGIENFDENIKKEEIILIKNKNFPKILCIGICKFSSLELENLDKGVIVENIHFINDKYF